jgi:hypothetical protein
MDQRGEIEKLAQSISLGEPVQVGQEMAAVIGFILRSLPPEDRMAALANLKQRIATLNAAEISSKSAPPTATIGQSLTFVKTLLNGLPYNYIQTVLDSTLKSLG